MERVPEDARRAAAAREVHLRDDRGAQGPGHDPEPLPALRLQAHPRAARSPRACATCSSEEKIAADDAAVALIAREAAGQHARRDEPARSGHRLGRRRKLVGSERGARARRRRRAACSTSIAAGAPRRATPRRACGIVADLARAGLRRHARRARPPRRAARSRGRQGLPRARAAARSRRRRKRRREGARRVAPTPTTSCACTTGFSTPFDDMAKSADVRAALEMLLVRLARRPPLVPIDDLVARLAELEQRLSSGGPGPPGPSQSAGGAGSAPSRSAEPRPGLGGPVWADRAVRQDERTFGGRGAAHLHARRPASSPRAMAGTARWQRAPRRRPARPFRASPVTPASARAAANPAAADALRAPGRADHGPARDRRRRRRAGPSRRVRSNLDAWRAVLAASARERAPLASILEHASPIAFSAERVVLGYEPGSFWPPRRPRPRTSSS